MPIGYNKRYYTEWHLAFITDARGKRAHGVLYALIVYLRKKALASKHFCSVNNQSYRFLGFLKNFTKERFRRYHEKAYLRNGFHKAADT